MNITKDPEFRKQLLTKIAEREFHERTGVHQSDLNYCLNKQALRRLYPRAAQDHETLIYSLGWSTQRWLTGSPEDEAERELDGIIVTCDALEGNIPWELKCTYMGNTKAIEESPHWVRQCMAQCKVMGSTVAYLSRLEIMGNWKWVYRPSKPEKILELIAEFGENWDKHPTLTAYRLEFTQPEIDELWGWLKLRRELFLAILETKELLPKAIALPPGGEYECEYCERREDCESK